MQAKELADWCTYYMVGGAGYVSALWVLQLLRFVEIAGMQGTCIASGDKMSEGEDERCILERCRAGVLTGSGGRKRKRSSGVMCRDARRPKEKTLASTSAVAVEVTSLKGSACARSAVMAVHGGRADGSTPRWHDKQIG
mmetsp:Transcript_47865/g.95571  ORF Transcript_47865/g.95571 Transcript_47865/m.95571 type:complete len:139 (+) Transcript_47865:1257-1673(+)